MATDLMKEAAKLYPDMAISPSDWRKLWDDPNAQVRPHSEADRMESVLLFKQLSKAIDAARELVTLIAKSQACALRDLQKREARDDAKQLLSHEPTAKDAELLPHHLGEGAWWYANELVQARVICRKSATLSPNVPDWSRLTRHDCTMRKLFGKRPLHKRFTLP